MADGNASVGADDASVGADNARVGAEVPPRGADAHTEPSPAEPSTEPSPAEPSTEPSDGPSGEEAARLLFRYLTGDEWRDYRAIMAVFAGTFFSEFSPEDVESRLAAAGWPLDLAAVAQRLESLRGWGNLTVSTSVGNPSNLRDYYKRRNRYLITRSGQEVHEAAEGVLRRVDEVRDVSTGRLRAIRDALVTLEAIDETSMEPERLADAVRAVFDPHIAFTNEITQFFVAINQWQARYDLTPDEFRFFAEVLVGYVADRLDEIERTSRPIGHRLKSLAPRVPVIVARASAGLADRVQQAGLDGVVTVSHVPGSTEDDWRHLQGWFVSDGRDRSRIDQLTRDAVSAIRTLTLNLTRLSRVGIAASSRRADFLRLAGFFASADPHGVHRLGAAAFGLYPSTHWGVLAEDTGDPVPTGTPWADAPRAPVPVALRERGETANRGRPTPISDRSQSQRLLRHRREQEAEDRRRIDAELVTAGTMNGASLSAAALGRLQLLVGRALPRLGTAGEQVELHDGELTCVVSRRRGDATRVTCPDGTLLLRDLTVRVAASADAATAAAAVRVPAPSEVGVDG